MSPYDKIQFNEREKYNRLHALYQIIKNDYSSDLRYIISREMSKIDGKDVYGRF